MKLKIKLTTLRRFLQGIQRSIRIRKIPQLHRQIHVQKHLLCLLLAAIVVQTGFKTKTQLQQLAEGKIEYRPLKKKNTIDKRDNKEIKQKSINLSKIEQQELEVEEKQTFTMLDFFQ